MPWTQGTGSSPHPHGSMSLFWIWLEVQGHWLPVVPSMHSRATCAHVALPPVPFKHTLLAAHMVSDDFCKVEIQTL